MSLATEKQAAAGRGRGSKGGCLKVELLPCGVGMVFRKVKLWYRRDERRQLEKDRRLRSNGS